MSQGLPFGDANNIAFNCAIPTMPPLGFKKGIGIHAEAHLNSRTSWHQAACGGTHAANSSALLGNGPVCSESIAN